VKKVLVLGGDLACVKKLEGMDFESINNVNFRYIHPSRDLGPQSEIYSTLDTIISNNFITRRAKAKFAYKISKNFLLSRSFKIQLGVVLLSNYRVRSIRTFYYFLRYIIKIQTLLYYCSVIMGFLKIPEYIVDKLINYNLKEHELLSKILAEIKPSFTIILSSGYDNLIYLSKIVEKNSFGKLILIINNWDNLSSKGFIGKEIDYVALWNHQQINHSTKISKVSNIKLTVIGSPTADSAYFKYSTSNLQKTQKNNPNKRLLYIGQQSKYDEISDVKRIATLLNSNNSKYNSLTYRPHPFTMSKTKQILAQQSNLTEVDINTDREIDLLEFDAIITLPTTFLLEVILSRVPAVLYLPSNKLYRKDPATMWQYTHFDPLRENLPMVSVKDLNVLQTYIVNGFPQQNIFSNESIDNLFPRFSKTYEERVDTLLTKILEKDT
jgi:hypothetical protein